MKKRNLVIILFISSSLILAGCDMPLTKKGHGSLVKEIIENSPISNIVKDDKKISIINANGSTIKERFALPEGYQRVNVQPSSFAEFLRNLPLKPDGTRVTYYNGNEKPGKVYDAVLDIDVGEQDLQQCADAVMRLRAEYLYKMGKFDKISFNFVSGFKADYQSWMQGNRVIVEDGKYAKWVKKAPSSNDYKSFRQYMDIVFTYAGTVSLEKELKQINVSEIQIGDVFIKGSLPGHCVIVVDMAENLTTKDKIFMVAQSYMPAQDIHILKSEENKDISPWISVDFGEKLETPEWTFSRDQLRRFID